MTQVNSSDYAIDSEKLWNYNVNRIYLLLLSDEIKVTLMFV